MLSYFFIFFLFSRISSSKSIQSKLITYDECLNVRNGPYSCSSDCTELNYCISGRKISVDCSQLTNGDRPFCDGQEKQCVESTEDHSCSTEENCPIGFSPDLTNCRRYTFCDGAHKYYHECKNKTIFNPIKGKCEEDSIKTKCLSYSTTQLCRNKTGPVEYPWDTHKYVFCLKTGPVLMQCGYFEMFYKDGCIFKCPDVGLFADYNNKRGYYDCKLDPVNKIILPTRKKCSVGFEFYEDLSICLKTI